MKSKIVIISALSGGWLTPAYITYSWFVASKDPRNSFPFLNYSVGAFGVTCIWLGLVIAAWSGFLASRLTSKQADEMQVK